MWSVSEKVASLRQQLDDLNFSGITYRKGASGWVDPVLRGTGIRVQTFVVYNRMGITPEQIAADYELEVLRLCEALAFYKAHSSEIDINIREENAMEDNRG